MEEALLIIMLGQQAQMGAFLGRLGVAGYPAFEELQEGPNEGNKLCMS